MLAAEAAFGVLNEGLDMNTYWDALRNSWIWEELYKSRNYRPVSEAIHCHFSTFLSLHYYFFQTIFAFIFKSWTKRPSHLRQLYPFANFWINYKNSLLCDIIPFLELHLKSGDITWQNRELILDVSVKPLYIDNVLNSFINIWEPGFHKLHGRIFGCRTKSWYYLLDNFLAYG